MGATKAVILLLAISVIKRRANLALVLSFIAPVTLTTTMCSIPTMSSIVTDRYLWDIYEEVTILSPNDLGNNCIEVYISEVTLGNNIRTFVLIPRDPQSSLSTRSWLKETRCELSGEVISMPFNLYKDLRGPCVIKLKLDNDVQEFYVAFTHDRVNAIILLNGANSSKFVSNKYLCDVPEASVVSGILRSLEGEVLGFIDVLILALIIASAPGIYVSSLRASERVRDVLRVLIFSGLDVRATAIYAGLSLFTVGILSVLFLTFTSVIALYAGSNLLALFTPSLVFKPRYDQIVVYDLVICLVAGACSIIASLKVLRSGVH